MMNRQPKFSNQSLFSLVLLLLALVLAGMTTAELIQIYRGNDQDPIQKEAVANDQDQDNYEAMIETAVKAGKLTKEQAQTKLTSIKKAPDTKDQTWAKDKAVVKDKAGATDKGQDYYQTMVKRIAEAVKSGQLTQEQAKAKLEAINKSSDSKSKTGAETIKSMK